MKPAFIRASSLVDVIVRAALTIPDEAWRLHEIW